MMFHSRRTLMASMLAAGVLCALSVTTLRAQIGTVIPAPEPEKKTAPGMMAMHAPTKAVATLHATKKRR